MSHLLSRLRLAWKRGRGHLHSPDTRYFEKLFSLQVCIRKVFAWPEQSVLLWQDEMSFYRQPSLAHAYEQTGTQQPLAELGHRSNSLCRIVGALDVRSGRLLFRMQSRIGVRELVAFYQQIAQAYPEAERLYLVQDNWPVHAHPDVLAALCPQQLRFPCTVPRQWPTQASLKAKRLGLPIRPLFLPTYAPWTNPIEKVWRKLRQEVLHLHRFGDDWTGLKHAVQGWLEQFASGSQALLRYVGLSDPLTFYEPAFVFGRATST